MLIDCAIHKKNKNAKEALEQMAKVETIYSSSQETSKEVTVFASAVSAGTPQPVEDFIEGKIDLNHHLIHKPDSTFIVRVTGDSMVDAGIHPGDLLIVDRSLTPTDGRVVIASLNGDLTVKRLCKQQDKLFLMPENTKYSGIEVQEEMGCRIWGVVTNCIHPL